MENREFIKEEIERLFTQYGNYSEDLQLLATELATYISYYLLDDNCILKRKYKNYTNGIKDKICKISDSYTPLNTNLKLKEDIVEKGTNIAKGVHGEIFSTIIDGDKVITKAPLKWDTDYIVENFISYRILNTILINGVLVNNLVPSYSLFTCKTNLLTPLDYLIPGKYFKKLKIGESVAIITQQSVPSSYPKRIVGMSGKVVGVRGMSMIVKLMDGNLSKQYIVKPIHLKKLK